MSAAEKTHKVSMYRIQAEHIANHLLSDLQPLCQPEKCVIAGSLRCRKEKVNDIEIVCIPRWDKALTPGKLFPHDQNLVINYLQKGDFYKRGINIIKGGPRYHQIIFQNAQVDVFMTTAEQWGRILALRTGPDIYSIKLASRWKELGYQGVDGELVKREGIQTKPKFPTEKSFFDFLGWDYVEPEMRR